MTTLQLALLLVLAASGLRQAQHRPDGSHETDGFNDFVIGAGDVLRENVGKARNTLQNKITKVTGMTEEDTKWKLTDVAETSGLWPYFEEAAEFLRFLAETTPTDGSGSSVRESRSIVSLLIFPIRAVLGVLHVTHSILMSIISVILYLVLIPIVLAGVGGVLGWF